MHILLLILKIIGIILLVLIGVLAVLILLLVFVPFCYRAEGSYYGEKPYAMARIRYLFPLLQVLVKYESENLEGQVKVFGIKVYDLFAEKDEETKQQQDETPKEKTVTADVEKEEFPKPKTESAEISEDDAEEEPGEDTEEEKLGFFEKIKKFIETIKKKIESFLQKIKDIREKGLEIKEKVTYYYNIWQQDYTQRAFQKAKSGLYKLWKSIRPKKGLVKFHFGTGDPGSTGQMCGYFGMLYPFIGKYVMIEPDFENKIYEGDFYFKGHLTVFALLKVAWVVLFDKDIKRLREILMNSDKEES